MQHVYLSFSSLLTVFCVWTEAVWSPQISASSLMACLSSSACSVNEGGFSSSSELWEHSWSSSIVSGMGLNLLERSSRWQLKRNSNVNELTYCALTITYPSRPRHPRFFCRLQSNVLMGIFCVASRLFRNTFNVPRDWFETNSWHQKRYPEGGKKNSWVSRSTGKSKKIVIISNIILRVLTG